MRAARRTLLASLAAAALTTSLAVTPAEAAFPGSDGLIAFVRNGNTYAVSSSGTDLRLVARNATMPRWSPDGRRLALLRRGNVWVMSADGTHQVQATRAGGISAITWSPDGAWLGAVSTPAGGPTGIVKLRSGAPFGTAVPVTDFFVENRSIAWSPDGLSIAFNGGGWGRAYPCVNDGLT